jgi:glycosyltransferase involved in cell wall biosynthesis
LIDLCYIIGQLGVGGAEKQLVQLILHIDSDRFRARVISLGGGPTDSPFVAVLRSAGIPVHVLPYRHRRDLMTIPRLWRSLAARPPDVVHCFLTSANIYGTIAARLAGISAVVISERSVGNNLGGWSRAVYPLAYRLSAKTVTNTRKNLELIASCHHVPLTKLTAIPNGCALPNGDGDQIRFRIRTELGLGVDDFVVGSVTHLTMEKEVSTFLLAARELVRTGCRARFVVVGDGRLRDAVKAQAAANPETRSVIFTGYRPDGPLVMRSFDCFVLPSKVEGMPNALMEAMSIGLPCIASDVGGIPELIRDGVHGLLVQPGDYQALADRIRRLKESTAMRVALGTQAASRIANDFTVEGMVRAYQDLYLSFDGRIQ